MIGPTREQVHRIAFGLLGHSPSALDVADELTDQMMAALAETQPKVLAEKDTYGLMDGSEWDKENSLVAFVLPVPPGTRVVVVAAGGDDRMPTICLSCMEPIPAADYMEHRSGCQDDIKADNERIAGATREPADSTQEAET